MSKNKVPNFKIEQEPMFMSWKDPALDGGVSLNAAMAESARASKKIEGIQRTAGSRYKNSGPDIHIREETSRYDYEAHRPSESVARESHKIIRQCINAYRKNGLIRNIIDLMGDFTVQGIEIVHPQAKWDKFYKAWAKKVKLKKFSERFANMLYKGANVPVVFETAKLKEKDIKRLVKTNAATTEYESPEKPRRNEIPIEYKILSPTKIDVLGDDLALFVGKIQYGQKIPQHLIPRIKNPQNAIDKSLVSVLKPDVKALVENGIRLQPLDPNYFRIFHYKKDDSDLWAEPMTYAIMDNLILYDKLMRADIAALDGAISHIRLWRLGSLEHKIVPTEAAIAKLAEVLVNNIGGGAMDLIWGPELDVKETSVDVHKFLGREKYLAPLEAIYAGLGVPPTLTGSANSSGFTNNSISLKTLIERLNYGRSILLEFWEEQFTLLAEALGSEPPTLRFTHMTLTDEAAELRLLIELLDRGILSDDTLLERFGEIPKVEQWRIRRDEKARKSSKKPAKVGPYHTDTKKEMKKRLLEQGVVAPSEVGLELEERKDDKTPLEIRTDQQAKLREQSGGQVPPNSEKKKGKAGQGRPLNKKDSQKRDRKRVLPRTAASKFATTFAWAREAQRTISDILNPIWLEKCGKTNMRKLSDEEANQIESFKYAVLCNLEPFTKIDGEVIAKLSENSIYIPEPVESLCRETSAEYLRTHGREPGVDDYRGIQASVYVLWKGGIENG